MWRRLDGKFITSSSAHTPSLTRTSLDFSPSPGDLENQPPPYPISSSDKRKLDLNEETSKQNNNSTSFQSLINNIASKQSQSDVTVSYYFICLLHLANEKVILN
jgi:hypothetical protein